MQNPTLWRGLLGVDTSTIIETVTYDEHADCVIVQARPSRRLRPRCGKCGTPSPVYDPGDGERRWRALDLGSMRVFLNGPAPRVCCAEHGVTVGQVPWARHGARHTHAFDQQTAWLATTMSGTAACELMRVAWRTVGAIISRVWADTRARVDLFADLTRIGIDEISYKKCHKYLTVVVCHTTGRLVWAAPGRNAATLAGFFRKLEASGVGRCQKITHVTADGADWIQKAVIEHCPNAVVCADPFHVVKWATDALDQVRREEWNTARRIAAGTNKRGPGRPAKDERAHARERARGLKGARYALWKNPEDLSGSQAVKLAWIQHTSPRLHEAYLLKEGLRTVFRLDSADAAHALEHWRVWAAGSGIEVFKKLADTIGKHQGRILAAIKNGLSNGLIESVNTKIRLLTRVAFGFKFPEALVGLAMLSLGGHRPRLPGRS